MIRKGRRPIILVAVGGFALMGAGYLGGAVYASASGNSESDGPPPVTTDSSGARVYPEDLPPLQHLGNGATVGDYRLDTPLDERPEFVETRIDGKVGYLRLSDINDGLVLPSTAGQGPINVTKLMADAERRRQDVMVQPNSRGELWAPVYAADGETVIGKKLIN